MAAEPQIYEFFAEALLYPDAAFAAKLQARAQSLSAASPWARQMIATLDGEGLEELQVEHVRLFVNAYGGSPCLPYESVYAEGQALGEVAQEVAALYARWGVEETGEMPDHAAVELAFAAQLARLQQVLEPEDDREIAGGALAEFERAHLRAWMPGLAADLQAAAEAPFYRELGAALQAVFGVKQGSGRRKPRAASDPLFLDPPT